MAPEFLSRFPAAERRDRRGPRAGQGERRQQSVAWPIAGSLTRNSGSDDLLYRSHGGSGCDLMSGAWQPANMGIFFASRGFAALAYGVSATWKSVAGKHKVHRQTQGAWHLWIGRRKKRTQRLLGSFQYRRWDSNPHRFLGLPDFESGASAISPLRRGDCRTWSMRAGKFTRKNRVRKRWVVEKRRFLNSVV